LLSLNVLLGGFGLSADKRIPLRVVNAPLNRVERFLGLYFCADGWADRSGVHYGSKSKQVCLALKRMLLRFGITSNLNSREIADHGTHYALSVADKGNAKTFARLVGPHLTEQKAAKVERWLAEWPNGASATNIGIPSSFLASELARRQAVTGRTKRHLGVDTGGYTTCRVLHRSTLAGLLYSERLEDLRTGDLVWDTVVSIESVGDKECFDFRMADGDRPYALAEDFLVHNCGKKDRALIAKEREKFVAGCESTGYGPELGTKLFDVIEPFADYAFNKSHSYGYGLVAYQTAYLKAHYPVEYLAALLTSVKDDKDRTAIYLNECRQVGISVLAPDVNLSASDFIARDETIPFGLSAIRNVGEGLVKLVLEEREANGPFSDFYDFCNRVDPSVLNKRAIESLIKAGAFDSLGHPRKGLLAVFEPIVDNILARRREREVGIMSLFDDGSGDDAVVVHDERLPIPSFEFERTERLVHEKEMLGLYVSDHPLIGADELLRANTDCTIAQLRELREGDVRWVGGVVTGLKRRYTKRGELMATFTLEDLESAVEVMVFPRTMHDCGPLLADDAILCVKGRLDLREEPAKIVCVELKQPEAAAGPPALRIKLAAESVTEPVINQLRAVLREHPGPSEVFLELGSKVLRLSHDFRVDVRNGLCAELRVLLGANGLVVER
jgi:DNA polymerase-3 subunit alpha